MIKTDKSKIVKIAQKLNKEGKKWHFHILSPGCIFNKNKQFALILEDSENDKQYIYLSLKKAVDTGQKLVELLHGKGVSKNKKTKQGKGMVSSKVQEIVAKAKELNNKGIAWHHHLLFPDCIFNTDPRYYTLVFEDPLNKKVIKDISKEEPKEALQLIESLLFAHKK
jgi:hypothetical protein